MRKFWCWASSSEQHSKPLWRPMVCLNGKVQKVHVAKIPMNKTTSFINSSLPLQVSWITKNSKNLMKRVLIQKKHHLAWFSQAGPTIFSRARFKASWRAEFSEQLGDGFSQEGCYLQLLGGGFKYVLFSPRSLRKMNPFWRAYFSNGWEKPTN